MKPVLVITAVPQEAALLGKSLQNPANVKGCAFPYVSGSVGALPVVICVGGIGKVNAAAASAVMIERVQPRLVINTGCAGAYAGSGLGVGSLAVASNEVLGDEGVFTANEWLDMKEIKLSLLSRGNRRYYNEAPLSRHAAEKCMRLADYCGIRMGRGNFITVSACSGSLRRGEELAGRYDGICENMEGAAVAFTCLRYGVDCLEIRGISNLVGDRDMSAWDIPRAVEAAQRFVLKYLEEMQRPDTSRRGTTVPEL